MRASSVVASAACVQIMRASDGASREILLLDEPMAGVNPTLRLTIEEHLQRLRDGRT